MVETPRANLWIGRLLESLGEILNLRHRNRVDGLLAVYSLLQTYEIRADTGSAIVPRST